MAAFPNLLIQIENCVPSLQAALSEKPLDLTKIIHVAMPIPSSEERPVVPASIDRHKVGLTDGTEICVWEVKSLTELFRGDSQPPPLGDHPEAYPECFMLLENHVLDFSHSVDIPRDEEMLEIYSTLRRRPEGKSLGFLHDFMWQTAALMLGSHVLSKAEFEAILSRLERSCRTFRMGPTSRNYAAALERSSFY